MANELNIRIAAKLNTGLSIKQINTAIRGIEKKIKKLKLNVDINDSTLKTLKDFNTQMQRLNKSSLDAVKSFGNVSKEYATQDEALKSLLRQQERRAKKIQEETIGLSKQKKTLDELTKGYAELNKQTRISSSGDVRDVTTTYRNEQGHGRVVRSDSSGNVIDYKDIENIEKFRKEQDKLRGSLQELAKSGRYTTEELRKIGQGISFAKTVNELDQMQVRMSNMRFGTNFTQDQERVRQSLTNIYNQGKITEQQFKSFNNSINSSKNIAELEKLQNKLKQTTLTSDNSMLQSRLVSDAQNLMRTHSNTVDRKGVSELVTELNRIVPSSRNASNSLKAMQMQLRQYSNEAREAARSSMTIMDAFQTAMVKFPINYASKWE